MTVTLAWDAAGDLGSVAASRAGQSPAVVRFGHRRHAAELAPSILRALSEVGATHADVSRVIVADGPGSFTGLRIGFATALGLIHARPTVAAWVAPSLLATAWASRDQAGGKPVVAMYDALRGDVYAAIYRFTESRVEVLLAPQCGTVASIAAQGHDTPVLAVGDGAVRYADEVRRWTGRAAAPAHAERSGAPALLQLLDITGGATPVPDLGAYEPNYGRPAEAQARWERASGRPLPHS